MSGAEGSLQDVSKLNDHLQAMLQGCTGCMSLAIGYHLNLFNCLSSVAPTQDLAVDSQTLADLAGCKERYVREWLRSLAVINLINHNDDGDKFFLSKECANMLTSAGIISEFARIHGRYQPKILECFSKDGPLGTNITDHVDLHQWRATFPNSYANPSIVNMLIDGMGCREKLESGGLCVVDLGCGSARFLKELAQRYPDNSYYAVEIEEEMLQPAREHCKDLPHYYRSA